MLAGEDGTRNPSSLFSLPFPISFLRRVGATWEQSWVHLQVSASRRAGSSLRCESRAGGGGGIESVCFVNVCPWTALTLCLEMSQLVPRWERVK